MGPGVQNSVDNSVQNSVNDAPHNPQNEAHLNTQLVHVEFLNQSPSQQLPDLPEYPRNFIFDTPLPENQQSQEGSQQEDQLSERKSVGFMEIDEPNGRMEKHTSSLVSDSGDQKLSLGDFRTLALTDIDESLRLPEEELEKFVKTNPAGKRGLARSEEPNNVVGERGRLRIHNVGGSLTFLLQIALLAWGIRQLRSVLAKRRQKQAPRINTVPFRPCEPPPFTTLSALAVKKLVDTNPTPHLLIDVRFPEAVRANPFFPSKNTINVPEAEVRNVLQLSEAEWANRFPSVKGADRSQLLVFVSTKGRRAQHAAIAAAELGYNGCCVLSGGIPAFHALFLEGEQFQHSFLSRDALAILLQNLRQNTTGNITSPKPYLIDVRRHDERALYGHIYGSIHVPVNEWPKALVMEPSDWERNYGCPKFQKEDLIILYCRMNNQSSWAAQVAHDAGVNRCFVCKGGVLGWRLDATVLPYDGYALGDPPPEPHKFKVETVNYEAAEQELQELELH